MGMMTLIVKGGVPAELAVGNLHRPCHIHGVVGQQLAPAVGVVVAQPRGVLPPQGDEAYWIRKGIQRRL